MTSIARPAGSCWNGEEQARSLHGTARDALLAPAVSSLSCHSTGWTARRIPNRARVRAQPASRARTDAGRGPPGAADHAGGWSAFLARHSLLELGLGHSRATLDAELARLLVELGTRAPARTRATGAKAAPSA
jgi:hypothetical protein